MIDTNILLVDDDKDTCASMSDIFLDLDYTVDTAHDGPGALELSGGTSTACTWRNRSISSSCGDCCAGSRGSSYRVRQSRKKRPTPVTKGCQ